MISALPTMIETGLSAYAYSYPHKSSYRTLSPPIPLPVAWRDECLEQLFLYLHIPFCEMRCGFCNLFTASQPLADQVSAYLQTLSRQMQVVRSQLPEARFSQLALGGGTPTYLTAGQLERLFSSLETVLGVASCQTPTSVETSPDTADRQRLQVLAERGVERISLGVQSFFDDETHRMGRPQQVRHVHAALELIREFPFATLNIDLIYGDAGQSRESWLCSLREALRYQPEELYLYPLYVRPQTGLGRQRQRGAEHRLDLYRAGRDELLSRGYSQISMRCFRRSGAEVSPPGRYSCQSDGMVGLGCGARSYTRRLHYATRFAVTQPGVKAILNEWICQNNEELSLATHGIWLSEEEQRRRFVILSLLQAEGLAARQYRQRFGSDPCEDLPVLTDLVETGWICIEDELYSLTAEGMEHSDLIGPLLYSAEVRARLEAFVQL